jgi:hypothetical protein
MTSETKLMKSKDELKKESTELRESSDFQRLKSSRHSPRQRAFLITSDDVPKKSDKESPMESEEQRVLSVSPKPAVLPSRDSEGNTSD